MKNNTIYRILITLLIYLGIKYLGGEYGRLLLYPITLLVTFLHEFGHALGALLTGGGVENLQISPDGSGFTTTRGGNRAIILMGGYLGSAILGNLLFYIGVKRNKLAKWTIMALAIIMLVVGVIWINSLFTTGFLFIFAFALIFISRKTDWDAEILMFFGLASIIYIIQDFNVGPSSDLKKYAEIFVIIPANAWMYIWLGIALFLSFMNLRMIFREKG